MRNLRRVAVKTHLLPVDESLLPEDFRADSSDFDERWPRFEYRRYNKGEYLELIEMSLLKLSPEETRERQDKFLDKLVLRFKGNPMFYLGYELEDFSIRKMLDSLVTEDYKMLADEVFSSGDVSDKDSADFLGS